MKTEIPLPDGDCYLMENFLCNADADNFFNAINRDTVWHQPRVTMFGKRVPSPRLAAWHGDADAVYTYSGQRNQPLPWSSALNDLRARVECATTARFNSVLINMYRDGDDAMGWHADDEPELAAGAAIASVSLGATRRFVLRHRRRRDLAPVGVALAHGALLVMTGDTQRHWRHAVPRTRRPVGARINLTFRLVDGVGVGMVRCADGAVGDTAGGGRHGALATVIRRLRLCFAPRLLSVRLDSGVLPE